MYVRINVVNAHPKIERQPIGAFGRSVIILFLASCWWESVNGIISMALVSLKTRHLEATFCRSKHIRNKENTNSRICRGVRANSKIAIVNIEQIH